MLEISGIPFNKNGNMSNIIADFMLDDVAHRTSKR